MAKFETKARWPSLPAFVLAAWTCVPAVVVNLRGASEGTFFLLVVAARFVVLTEPDWRIRLTVAAGATLAPLFAVTVTGQLFSWPFWMIGIAFGCLSGQQMRRFRDLVTELEATRERLAAQAVHVERRRIAVDLHDLVGHSLTVVLLYLTGARSNVLARLNLVSFIRAAPGADVAEWWGASKVSEFAATAPTWCRGSTRWWPNSR